MKTEQVIEESKLIAEFMGASHKVDNGIEYICLSEWQNTHTLRFHTSWDWLMPVVEKIESVTTKKYPDGFIVRIEGRDVIILTLRGELMVCDYDYDGSKLERVYWMCLRFIQWYNENK